MVRAGPAVTAVDARDHGLADLEHAADADIPGEPPRRRRVGVGDVRREDRGADANTEISARRTRIAGVDAAEVDLVDADVAAVGRLAERHGVDAGFDVRDRAGIAQLDAEARIREVDEAAAVRPGIAQLHLVVDAGSDVEIAAEIPSA